MSEEQLKAFIEKVKADTSLQEKLKAAADTNAVVAIAKEAGFSISAEDYASELYASELSDEELEGAAGGLRLTSWVLQFCTGTLKTSPESCWWCPQTLNLDNLDKAC